MRFSPLPLLAKITLLVFGICTILVPLPYVVMIPGDAVNIFNSTITIKNHTVYPAEGRLDLISIRISNPDSLIFGPEVFYTWFKGDRVVYPRSAVYRNGTTTKSEEASAKKDMQGSQNTSISAALTYLNKNSLAISGTPFKPADIKFDIKATGGPSGGLVFALGIIELLTQESILGKNHIAGTGTISATGAVGPIGGITEKIIAAKRAGATIFLAPIENCLELTKVPKGMSVIAVTNLSDAIQQLQPFARGMRANFSSMKTSNGCAKVVA